MDFLSVFFILAGLAIVGFAYLEGIEKERAAFKSGLKIIAIGVLLLIISINNNF